MANTPSESLFRRIGPGATESAHDRFAVVDAALRRSQEGLAKRLAKSIGESAAEASIINVGDVVAQNPLLQEILATAEFGKQWPPSPKWNEFRSFMPSMSEAALSSPDAVEATVKQFAGEVNAVLAA